MKELTLYVIYATEDGETVDCGYTIDPQEANEIKADFQNAGYGIQSEEHHFTKDKIETLLYESIYGEFRP